MTIATTASAGQRPVFRSLATTCGVQKKMRPADQVCVFRNLCCCVYTGRGSCVCMCASLTTAAACYKRALAAHLVAVCRGAAVASKQVDVGVLHVRQLRAHASVLAKFALSCFLRAPTGTTTPAKSLHRPGQVQSWHIRSDQIRSHGIASRHPPGHP